ncbi:MAG: hypothetical protein JWR83_461 [Aeromicrobium sp.]|nr:hypothetical protein [Aeromicrobium sp.]
MNRRQASSLLGAAALLTLTACTGSSDNFDTSAKPSATETTNCDSAVKTDSLPTWARGGFTPGDQAIPHVIGARGDMVGVLFGFPLSSPPSAGRSNKILWVSRPLLTTPSDLKIHATLDGTSTVADRKVVGGPGPSYVNLPKSGCWTLNLRWSGHVDSVRLKYVKG